MKIISIKFTWNLSSKLKRIFLEAANIFKKLISNKIISESIFNNYGIALKNLKEFNTAKYYFKKSIKLNNKNFTSLF